MESAAVPLLAELDRLIAESGPLTFDRYMRCVLYHPQHGYYTSRVPGSGVSYATSASIGPWFGAAIARELTAMWEALGRPDPFVVTEFGAGLAGLATAAIRSAGPLANALRWRIVEQFDAIEQMQRRSLGPEAERVEWLRDLDGRPPVTGCILANEVLDNFPFHRFEKTSSGIEEVYVGSRNGDLVEVTGPVSDPSLVAPVQDFQAKLSEGDRFEVFTGIDRWCIQVGRTLERGYLLVVDYGDEEPDIWLRGKRGTLKTYSTDGPMGTAPLERPGHWDITADVNFTELDRLARGAGFEFELLTLQRFWLASLGLAADARQLGEEAELARAFGWASDARLLEEEQRGMMRLLDAEGLGGCLVYRASKGVKQP
ncbi:MAG TPA: SAM-dependent methyltransferase [Actinomycetota bacterium]|nr:SAM-dependent methyltransferase [Actinomycetota bacterium]